MKEANRRFRSEQLHHFVLFAGNTGLRPDETWRLEFRDVTAVNDEDLGKTIPEIEVRGKLDWGIWSFRHQRRPDFFVGNPETYRGIVTSRNLSMLGPRGQRVPGTAGVRLRINPKGGFVLQRQQDFPTAPIPFVTSP